MLIVFINYETWWRHFTHTRNDIAHFVEHTLFMIIPLLLLFLYFIIDRRITQICAFPGAWIYMKNKLRKKNNLRFAQLLGSGSAKRRWANAIVAPIVSSVNVRSTDILPEKRNEEKELLNHIYIYIYGTLDIYFHSTERKSARCEITSGMRAACSFTLKTNDFTWSRCNEFERVRAHAPTKWLLYSLTFYLFLYYILLTTRNSVIERIALH